MRAPTAVKALISMMQTFRFHSDYLIFSSHTFFKFQILFSFAQLAIWLLQLRDQIYNHELLASLVDYIDVRQWLFIEAGFDNICNCKYGRNIGF